MKLLRGLFLLTPIDSPALDSFLFARGGGLLEVILLCVVSMLIYLAGNRLYVLQKRSALRLEGPPALPGLGNFLTMRRIMVENGMRLYEVHLKWREEFGKTYGFYLGPRLCVVFERLEDVHEILVKQFSSFTDRQPMDFMQESLRNALVNQKGSRWHSMRHRVSPAFTIRKLRMMECPLQEKISILCIKMRDAARSEIDFNILRAFQSLTLDVIAGTGFGMISHCQTDPSDPFLEYARRFFTQMPTPENCRLMAISLILPEISHFCEFFHRKTSTTVQPEQWLVRNLREVVKKRLEKPEPERTDIISLLLATSLRSDSSETIDAIVSNCFAFLLAGYETTSTSLAFATWLLAKNPETQLKLLRELEDELLHKDHGEWFSAIMKLPYLNGVFKESLRLFPPITFFVNRTCTSPCIVGDVKMDRGVVACIPVWNIHRDPEHWPQPEKFIPERFIDQPAHHPMAWLPFGAGPRFCIGTRFAEMEFKMTLARILLQFQLTLAEDSEKLVLLNPSVMLAPEKVNVIVKEREKWCTKN